MTRIHSLKTWPEQFSAVVSGAKRFEYRKNDRGFKVGDALILLEYVPSEDVLTRNAVTVRVTYIAENAFGIPDGYCVMSIEPVAEALGVRS